MSDDRPLLAIVTGHLTPYRIAFHRRIAAEVADWRLATLVTKYRTGPWVNPDVPEIGTVRFDPDPPPGQDASMSSHDGGRSRIQHIRHEMAIARRVRAWLDEHRPRAIICGGYDEIPVMTALRWAGRNRAAAFLWTDSNIHGDRSVGWRRRLKNIYVPRVCARYRGVLVCGEAGKQFFRRYGVGDDRLFVMPVEPDYAAIEQMTDDRADAIAASLGLEPERKRLVCCCRLIPLKRVDLAIDAFAAIAQARPEWDLIIVGKGESQPELERRAGDLLTRRRVRFLGFQDTTNLAAIYKRSHAMVLASDYEPWALVINEAAAAGLALVATDRVGAAYELVRDGRNGFMVPAGDLARLTEALRSVTDPATNDAMRTESRREIARWRRDADPIDGLRRALAAAGRS